MLREWLTNKRNSISVRDFRTAVEQLKRSRMKDEDRRLAEALEKKKPVILKISVSQENADRLIDIANAKKLGSRTANGALWWLAREYMKEHQAEIRAEVDSYKAAQEEEKRKADEEQKSQLARWAEEDKEPCAEHPDEFMAAVAKSAKESKPAS